MTVHSFHASLARSHAYSDAPWWLDVYRNAFPTLVGCHDMRADGWAQRGGMDRLLVLSSGKTLSVDEKVRERDWPDVLLEYWSDEEERAPGWIAKDLACDFIAYAFVPSQTCLLLPFHQLRLAWQRHRKEWVAAHKQVRADNGRYTTVSVAVPKDELMRRVGEAMSISWRDDAA